MALRCKHERHEEVLIGRSEEGGFKTTPAARYPAGMCQGLVETLFPDILEQAQQSDVIHGPELSEVLGEAFREAPERAGRCAPVRAALEWVDPVERWSEVFRVRWEHPEASNILETRSLLLAVKHLVRSRNNWGRRTLI